MPQAAAPLRPFLHRALVIAASVVGSGCSEPESFVVHGSPLTVSPSSAVIAPGDSLPFEATIGLNLSKTSPVRWRSSDSTIFRLDTTTTSSPHRVTGRAGRAGPAALTVSVGNALMTIPVTVRSPGAVGAR